MRIKTTYNQLQPGDQIYRAMRRWEVISVGEHLPNDTRVPVSLRCVGPRDEGLEKTLNLRGDYTVWTTRKEAS